MRIRWYRLAVIALWLAAMSWLVVRKILPPLLVGEPPLYASTDSAKSSPPVAWALNLNDHRIGWALSKINRHPTDVTEIHSLAHFDGSPLAQLLSEYMRSIVRNEIKTAQSTEMEVESHMLINPLNQLQSFDSKVKLQPYTGSSLVAIEGNMDGDKLKLSLRAAIFPQGKLDFSLPETKIRDSFSPETELRGLHAGQSWTIFSYNPLAVSHNPLELLKGHAPTEVLLARVEEETAVTWNGETVPVWLVVYRTEAGEGPDNNKNIRNRMWVRKDGMVLRQEVMLGGNSLLFSRMSEKDTAELHETRKEFFSKQP